MRASGERQTLAGGAARGLPPARFRGIGDNQASYIGSVREATDTVLVNIGTGAQASVLTDAFAHVPGIEARPFPGGRYLLVGAGLYGGASYALLRGLFQRIGEAFWGTGEARRSGGSTRGARAARERRATPPPLQGRTDPEVRGSQGMSIDSMTPGIWPGRSEASPLQQRSMTPCAASQAAHPGGSRERRQRNALLAHDRDALLPSIPPAAPRGGGRRRAGGSDDAQHVRRRHSHGRRRTLWHDHRPEGYDVAGAGCGLRGIAMHHHRTISTGMVVPTMTGGR